MMTIKTKMKKCSTFLKESTTKSNSQSKTATARMGPWLDWNWRSTFPSKVSLINSSMLEGGEFGFGKTPVMYPWPSNAREFIHHIPKNYGEKQMRNPMTSFLASEYSYLRSAERQSASLPPQLPPRITRRTPSDGPSGSMDTTARGYCPYQSRHHSWTLPCMSWSPQGLGL